MMGNATDTSRTVQCISSGSQDTTRLRFLRYTYVRRYRERILDNSAVKLDKRLTP